MRTPVKLRALQESNPVRLLPTADLLENKHPKPAPEQVRQLCERQGCVIWIKCVYRCHNDRWPADMASFMFCTLTKNLKLSFCSEESEKTDTRWSRMSQMFLLLFLKKKALSRLPYFKKGKKLEWDFSMTQPSWRVKIPVNTARMTRRRNLFQFEHTTESSN